MTNPPDPRLGATVLPLRRGDHEDAAGVAIRWLAERHRKGWRNAFDALLHRLRPKHPEDDWDLDDELMQMLSVNAGEWLIARGDIFVKSGLRPVNEYLLSRDGPYLTPGQQRWIAQLRERPLRLYRVTDVRVDEGLTLVDELDANVAPLVVQERSGSRSAQPGMLMGARVMDLGDHLELSGAIYPFAMLREAAVIAQVRAAPQAGTSAQSNQELAELAIARSWLAQWFDPLPIPELRDAASGEPLLLVTDHYRVLDADALGAALAAQRDVSGNAKDGWHRDGDAGGGLVRSLAAINPGRAAERIEVFYRTQKLADEGRAWFEGLAAAAVEHLAREITDPRSAAARAGTNQRVPAAPTLDPESLAVVLEQALRSHYANWADEPIPALGGQTPRRAMATPAGLERVKGLIRSYEAGEKQMAQQQGRPAISYDFLWQALGLRS